MEHTVTATEPAWVEAKYSATSSGSPELYSEPSVGEGIEMMMDEATYECSCGASLSSWSEVQEHLFIAAKHHVAVEVYEGRTSVEEYDVTSPESVLLVPFDEPFLWQNDPYYDSGPIGLRLHPESEPAQLNVYTNDSVREPHVSDTSEWNGPVERGLTFHDVGPDVQPFGCEIWGRVMMTVEELD